METRIFAIAVAVFRIDGNRLVNFGQGERVKNIHHLGTRVMFEPVSTHHIAGTFVMDWTEFIKNTTAVREVSA